MCLLSTSLPKINRNNTITPTQINIAIPGEYQPIATGIVPHNRLTKKDSNVNGIMVFACKTRSHPVDSDDRTVLSANGLHVLPNVEPAKTAAAACITLSSLPSDSVKASGRTSGKRIPIVPMAEPAAKLTTAANIVASGGSHSTGKFPCKTLDKYTEVWRPLITPPKPHANNKTKIGDIMSLKPVVHASTIVSMFINDCAENRITQTKDAAAADQSSELTESAFATMSIIENADVPSPLFAFSRA